MGKKRQLTKWGRRKRFFFLRKHFLHSGRLELRSDFAELLVDGLLGVDLALEVGLEVEQLHLLQLLGSPILPVLLGRGVAAARVGVAAVHSSVFQVLQLLRHLGC